MADEIGSLKFPPDPPTNTPISDQLITKFAAYLAAYLNANLSRTWAKLAPGDDRAVRTLATASSKRAWFNDQTLPALYVFRHQMVSERRADALYWNATDLYAAWIPPKVSDEQREKRDPFIGQVGGAIQMAVRLGRHPDWIDAGDTDPEAPTLGSVLVTRAGLAKTPQVTRIDYDPHLQITLGEKLVEFDAVLVHIECVEVTHFDPAMRSVPSKLEQAVKQGLGGVDGNDPANDFTVVRTFD